MYTDIVLSTIVKLHPCSFHCVADENADDMEASLTQAEESRRSIICENLKHNAGQQTKNVCRFFRHGNKCFHLIHNDEKICYH